MMIVIPSHRRAGTVTTHHHVAGAAVCVAESEKDSYLKFHPAASLIVHPDSVRGLAAKRQWIHETVGDVMMIDDDCDGIRRRWRPNGWPIRCNLDPETARDVILATADLARSLGAFLFGFANIGSSEWYDAQRPIRFGPFVRGGGVGILKGSRLWWPDRIFLGSDEWISLLNAHFHRFMLLDTRFYVSCPGTGTAPGGCQSWRTKTIEEESVRFLRASFGAALAVDPSKPAAESRSVQLPWPV